MKCRAAKTNVAASTPSAARRWTLGAPLNSGKASRPPRRRRTFGGTTGVDRLGAGESRLDWSARPGQRHRSRRARAKAPWLLVRHFRSRQPGQGADERERRGIRKTWNAAQAGAEFGRGPDRPAEEASQADAVVRGAAGARGESRPCSTQPTRSLPSLSRTRRRLPRDSPRRCFRSRLNAHRVEQLKDNHTKRGRDDLWPAPGISPIRLLESGPVVSRSGFLHQPER